MSVSTDACLLIFTANDHDMGARFRIGNEGKGVDLDYLPAVPN